MNKRADANLLPAQELVDGILEQRQAAVDHETPAAIHRRIEADFMQQADERGIPYPREVDHLDGYTIRTHRVLTNHIAAARVVSHMNGNELTQEKFPERAHIEPRTLRRVLEKHTASMRTWTLVAKVMGVTTREPLK